MRTRNILSHGICTWYGTEKPRSQAPPQLLSHAYMYCTTKSWGGAWEREPRRCVEGVTVTEVDKHVNFDRALLRVAAGSPPAPTSATKGP